MEYIEEFDKLKTKVLKYVLYKKRTEAEIRQKFAEESSEMTNEIIDFLKQENYINDTMYIERAINEFKNLKNLSIKELKYKLLAKGIKSLLLDDYIINHKEELLEYEINSAKNIINKKTNTMQKEDIINNLKKKGYLNDSLKIAIQELEE